MLLFGREEPEGLLESSIGWLSMLPSLAEGTGDSSGYKGRQARPMLTGRQGMLQAGGEEPEGLLETLAGRLSMLPSLAEGTGDTSGDTGRQARHAASRA
jgi:hypothetical protein